MHSRCLSPHLEGCGLTTISSDGVGAREKALGVQWRRGEPHDGRASTRGTRPPQADISKHAQTQRAATCRATQGTRCPQRWHVEACEDGVAPTPVCRTTQGWGGAQHRWVDACESKVSASPMYCYTVVDADLVPQDDAKGAEPLCSALDFFSWSSTTETQTRGGSLGKMNKFW